MSMSKTDRIREVIKDLDASIYTIKNRVQKSQTELGMLEIHKMSMKKVLEDFERIDKTLVDEDIERPPRKVGK